MYIVSVVSELTEKDIILVCASIHPRREDIQSKIKSAIKVFLDMNIKTIIQFIAKRTSNALTAFNIQEIMKRSHLKKIFS